MLCMTSISSNLQWEINSWKPVSESSGSSRKSVWGENREEKGATEIPMKSMSHTKEPIVHSTGEVAKVHLSAPPIHMASGPGQS